MDFHGLKTEQIDSVTLSKERHEKVDLLSGYFKVLSSNYGLFLANAGSYAITVPFLLKWLGPEKYGVYLIFLQLANIVSFATTWIAAPTVREAATCHNSADRQRTSRLFQTVNIYYALLGMAIIAFTMLGTPFFPRLFEVPTEIQADAAMALMLLSAYIAGTIQMNLLLSILTGFQHMHFANILLGMRVPLGSGLGLGAVAAGGGLTGFAAGQILATAIIYGLAWSITRKITGIALGIASFDQELLFNLIRSGMAYVGYSVSYLMLQSDILLIGIVLGPMPAAVYSISYKFMDYAVQLIWKIPDSLFPKIAALDDSIGRESLQNLHRFSGTIVMAAASLAAILIGLYGHVSIMLWVGKDNVASPTIFVAFSVTIILQVLVHSSLIISYGTNRMNSVSKASLVEGVFKIVISLLLLHHLGILGVALGSIFAQLCITAWYIPLSACKITGDSLPEYALRIFLPTLPAAIMTVILGTIVLFVVHDPWHLLLTGVPLTITIYFLIYMAQGMGNDKQSWIISKTRYFFGK